MEDFTSLPFYCFQGVEEPSLVYILGSWHSIEQHMGSWISSPENQALLQLMKDQVQVEWMFHVDIDPFTLPFEKPTLAIARHFVEADKKGGFEEMFHSVKHHLEVFVGGKGLVRGGWRIDKDEEKSGEEEWLLFTGWDSLENHLKFAKTEGFEEYTKIRDFSHAVKLDVR